MPPTAVHINPITEDAFSVLPEPSNDVAIQETDSAIASASTALVAAPTKRAPRLRGTSKIASIAT
jgi:hypothetical protein